MCIVSSFLSVFNMDLDKNTSLIILSFSPRFSSGCKVGGSCGPGAHLPFGPTDGPQDDDARGGPCRPGEAAAAGATPHPATAADPEAAPDCRVSEAARELDTAAPGTASGAHQGSKCVPASDLALRGPWAEEGALRGRFPVVYTCKYGLEERVVALGETLVSARKADYTPALLLEGASVTLYPLVYSVNSREE